MTYIHIHRPAEATGWWEERVDCTQQLVVSDNELLVEAALNGLFRLSKLNSPYSKKVFYCSTLYYTDELFGEIQS